jgi:hypothetical protein
MAMSATATLVPPADKKRSSIEHKVIVFSGPEMQVDFGNLGLTTAAAPPWWRNQQDPSRALVRK